jgi:hypothetical protein
MKTNKLKRHTLFIFKKQLAGLSKEEMKRVRGGNSPTTENPPLSTLPGCVEDKPTLNTVSL